MCSDGACITDPCDGVVCDTLPEPSCEGANTLATYQSPGTCTDGVCAYPSTQITCDFMCSDGACIPDPCDGIVCDTPPEPSCEDENSYLAFKSRGTCSEGVCEYAPLPTTCDLGCDENICYGPVYDGDYLVSQSEDITYLHGYIGIAGNLSIIGTDTTTIDGLSTLTYVGGDLRISDNPNLLNLYGLSNTTSIGGSIFIIRNNSLLDLDGLNSFDLGGMMGIHENSNLACDKAGWESKVNGNRISVCANAMPIDWDPSGNPSDGSEDVLYEWMWACYKYPCAEVLCNSFTSLYTGEPMCSDGECAPCIPDCPVGSICGSAVGPVACSEYCVYPPTGYVWYDPPYAVPPHHCCGGTRINQWHLDSYDYLALETVSDTVLVFCSAETGPNTFYLVGHCTKCGDGVCGTLENSCNCKVDCPPPHPELYTRIEYVYKDPGEP
jgi:hypothetical protein